MASGQQGRGSQRPSFAKIAAAGMKAPSSGQQRQSTYGNTHKHGITSAPRERAISVTDSQDHSNLNVEQARTAMPSADAVTEDQCAGSNKPEVQVHSVDGVPPQPQGSSAPGGFLAPATSEDSNTQVSSDSGSAKPPSLDGKSVASGTTFALDEKESLRPDDSASAKAADDEDVFSPPSAGLPSSQMGSEDARAFRDQLREISSMDPQRRAATPQGFRPPGNPQQGVLYIPPQGPGVGSVPTSRGNAERESQENTPDPKLMEALDSPRDRIWVLKLEQDIFDFVKDPKEASLNLPQCNAYHRMLAHKIADYYMLGHIVDDSASAVRLYKTPHCRIPPPLTGITTPSTAASTPPPAAPQLKILRRGIDAGPVLANGSNVPSKSGSEDEEGEKKSRPPATREEREARYEAARLRIMGSAKPTESPEETKPKTDSRASSVTGKKSKKKPRSTSDDDFEARSAYSAFYTPPYNANGYNASSYGFPAYPEASQPQQMGSVPVAVQQQAAAQGYAPYSPQTPTSMPWTGPGYPPGNGNMSWSQAPQPGYDLAANFQQAMSFQNSVQPSHAPQAPAGYPSTYQQSFYPTQQPWSQQAYQVPPQQFPQNNAASYPSYQPPSQPSPRPQEKQAYQYGQLPSQALGRPPNSLEHPLPGSYKGKHFNPQSQSFVPGQPGQDSSPAIVSSQPAAAAVTGGGAASPHPRQTSAQSQGPAYRSMRHANASSSVGQAQAQPMMHPLPQPVFPQQLSPSLPLPPKPGSTPQKNSQHHQSTPSPSAGSANGQSSIAKWGAPASLPAKPPPSAEPFNPGKFNQIQRQPSYNTAARTPSGGMSFGSMPPMSGSMGVNGMGGQR